MIFIKYLPIFKWQSGTGTFLRILILSQVLIKRSRAPLNFRAPLNLNVCKVMTGKHLCWGLFLNKAACWSTHTIFKWHSGTDTFLWILLSFTEHLFAKHLRNAVSDVLSQVLLFLCERYKTMKTSDSVTL